MQTKLLLVSLAIAAIAVVQAVPVSPVPLLAPKPGERLLEFNESSHRWVSEEQLFKILSGDEECAGFMDITEHQHLHPNKNYKMPAIPKVASKTATVKQMMSNLNADRIIETVTEYSSFRPNRFYKSETAKKAAEWLHGQYVKAAAGRSDISSRFFQHSWAQPSVITRIEGHGPSKHEVVVLGGHIDSINSRSPVDGVAPGADDDASGSSTVLEVFRALVEGGYKPDRTVEFHGYAAEEVGLLGSQDVVADYLNNNVNVASMLQMDMTLFQYQNNTKITLVNDYVSSDLTWLLRNLVEQYCDVAWQDSLCGYACSDHASWHKGGFPAAFPFETAFSQSNKAIHTPNDLVSLLNKEHGLQYAKLATAYVVEMAGEVQ